MLFAFTVIYIMARGINKLTALQVKKAKYTEDGQNKLTDGAGMYLLMKENGSKYWMFDYARPITKKRNTISFGVYPMVSLDEARQKRDEAKKQVAAGIDPAVQREQKKLGDATAAENTFRKVGDAWLAMRELEEKVDKQNKRRLNSDVYPYIGELPISLITTEILDEKVFKIIIERGALETAKRVCMSLRMIFRYAKQKKLVKENPAEDVVLPAAKKGNFPAITEVMDLRPLVQAIWSYRNNKRCRPATEAALKLSMLIFQRPGEIRQLRKEYYFKDERCLKFISSKTKQPHIVPLSDQAVLLIETMIFMYPHSPYIFPGQRNHHEPMSDGTVNNAIKRLGFGGQQTAHGLRATARTILDEVMETRTDFIEHQLAHKVKDSNGTAYNRTKHLDKRRQMMQEWADYIETLAD